MKKNDKKKTNRFANDVVLKQAVVVRPVRNSLLTGLLKGISYGLYNP